MKGEKMIAHVRNDDKQRGRIYISFSPVLKSMEAKYYMDLVEATRLYNELAMVLKENYEQMYKED